MEKRYTKVSGVRGEKGGFITFSDFIVKEGELSTSKNGKQLYKVGIPLKNVKKQIDFFLNGESQSSQDEQGNETTWVNITFFGPTAERAAKALKGEQVLVRVAGKGEITENGYVNLAANDFKVAYKKNWKSSVVGGDYSFATSSPLGDGIVGGAIEGYIAADSKLRETKDGKPFLTFPVALNKLGTKLTWAIDGKIQTKETEFIDVAYFGLNAEKLATQLVKGAAILTAGQVTAEPNGEYNNIRLAVNDVEIVRYKGKTAETPAPVENVAPEGVVEPEEIFDDSDVIEISDDDLPF